MLFRTFLSFTDLPNDPESCKEKERAGEKENATQKQTAIMAPQGEHAFWPDHFLCLNT